MTGFRPAVLVLLLLVSSPLMAQKWFDSYADGIKAARAKNWSVVVQKMSEAIAKKPNEGTRERSYGSIFVDYKPYYYRGVAHFNLGNFDDALRDLQRTAGPGELSLGTADSFIAKAEARLASNQAPAQPPPATTTQAASPSVVPTQQPAVRPTPSLPAVDPNLAPMRRRAEELIAAAERRRDQAMAREAQGYAASQFNSAQNLLLQAETRRAGAETAADWKAVGDLADRSQRAFSLAITTAQAAATKAQTSVNAVADDVLSPMKTRLRSALEDYFNGNFDRAATTFAALARSLGDNANIHAYLGASHYYSYYLGGNSQPEKLKAARDAFSRARRLNPKLTLSSKYFSPRVRTFFASVR